MAMMREEAEERVEASDSTESDATKRRKPKERMSKITMRSQ
jgi:hypothetical protein